MLSPEQHITSFIAHEPAYAPLGEKRGGAGAVAQAQTEALYRQGKSATIISPRTDSVVPSIPHEFFEKPTYDNNDDLLLEYRKDPWQDYFSRALNNGIIYGHYFVANGVTAGLKEDGILPNNPFIAIGHSWQEPTLKDPNRKRSPIRHAAETKVLKVADRIVVSTNIEKESLAETYADYIEGGKQKMLDKTSVVPLGLDTEVFNPARMEELRARARRELLGERYGRLDDHIVFFTLGRLVTQKGHFEAVQAVSNALRNGRDAKIALLIVGGPRKGDYYDQITNYISDQPEFIQNRILLTGAQPAETAIAAGDVFLGPSFWETWYLAMTEAMASGKPTIVSDDHIIREVAGTGSLFVNPRDINSISQAILHMANSPQDRQESSDYNTKRASRYTWGNSAAALRKVLEQVNP